jgi:hypothetical protein
MDSEPIVEVHYKQMDTRSEPAQNPIEDQIKPDFDPINAISSEPIEPLAAYGVVEGEMDSEATLESQKEQIDTKTEPVDQAIEDFILLETDPACVTSSEPREALDK